MTSVGSASGRSASVRAELRQNERRRHRRACSCANSVRCGAAASRTGAASSTVSVVVVGSVVDGGSAPRVASSRRAGARRSARDVAVTGALVGGFRSSPRLEHESERKRFPSAHDDQGSHGAPAHHGRRRLLGRDTRRHVRPSSSSSRVLSLDERGVDARGKRAPPRARRGSVDRRRRPALSPSPAAATRRRVTTSSRRCSSARCAGSRPSTNASTFEQYLFGICRNRTIDQMRRRRFVGTGADSEVLIRRAADGGPASGDESPSFLTTTADRLSPGRAPRLSEAAFGRWVRTLRREDSVEKSSVGHHPGAGGTAMHLGPVRAPGRDRRRRDRRPARRSVIRASASTTSPATSFRLVRERWRAVVLRAAFPVGQPARVRRVGRHGLLAHVAGPPRPRAR